MRIAIVLLRTLGDVVLLNTLAKEVKRIHPDGDIELYVMPQYVDLVQHNPAVHKVIPITEWNHVLREISRGIYDKVYVPYQTNRIDNMWHHQERYRHKHLIDFYAKRMGMEIQDRKLYLYPSELEKANGIKKYTDLGIKHLLVIHNSTLVESKNWGKFSELVKEVQELHLFDGICQLGALTDKPIEGCIDLREQLTFGEMSSFLSKCNLFIGLDSGISYIAAASGVHTFCIMGPTVPTTSGPFGENVNHILSGTVADCMNQRCHGNCRYGASCITGIEVQTVVDAIIKLT